MRDYDPTTGRYIQADPLGLVDGASVYGYARQNPERWTDPRGEQGISIPGGPFPGPGPVMSVAPGTPVGDALGQSLANDILPLLDPRPLIKYCMDSVVTPAGDGTPQCGDTCTLMAEHTKDARPSTKDRHEKGTTRKKKDRGGEKADEERNPPRKRPPNYKGPWPPR